MKQKTFKGKLKKAGLYTLCYSPLALAVASFGLFVGGGLTSSKYGEKENASCDEIYPKVLMTEEFKQHKEEREDRLVSALRDDLISMYDFSYQFENLTRKEYVVNFAKSLPEYSSQAKLAEGYEDKADAWMNAAWATFPTIGFAIGGAFSHLWADRNISNMNFDKVDDIEKQRKKLQAKQEKIAKKEKEL